jgi:hypothetical protein
VIYRHIRLLLLALKCLLVRNRQFLSAFSAAASQYTATVCSCHSFTKSVFVLPLLS